MRGELPKVTIADFTGRILLPDTPHHMWTKGELHDYLHLPHDGTRVEIIDGEIAVSPAPRFVHNLITQEIANHVDRAFGKDPSYRWRCVQNSGMDFIAEENGYIPDLLIFDLDTYEAGWETNLAYLVPDQAELVCEVTSPSTAHRDRPPGAENPGKGKWCGYARAEVPYYLLIDLDPAIARTTLYSIPDQASSAYLHHESWAFGETIVVPDPFGLEIPTDRWKPWA